MKFMNISDNHNHSSRSFDGSSTVLEMCERAKELGFIYHTLTDHCECDRYTSKERNYKWVADTSYDDMMSLRSEFPNLLVGVELGQPLQDLDAAKAALKDKDYDFVIGSLHNLSKQTDFAFWSDVCGDFDSVLELYLQELTEMVQWGQFDTLAHLTYPLRYLRSAQGEFLNFDALEDKIADLYKLLIEKNIALEVNCSGLRQSIGEVLPNLKLLKLYKSLGGKLITIGSDAHCTTDLGKGIEEGLQTLLDAGFTHYTVFIKREPHMIEIK